MPLRLLRLLPLALTCAALAAPAWLAACGGDRVPDEGADATRAADGRADREATVNSAPPYAVSTRADTKRQRTALTQAMRVAFIKARQAEATPEYAIGNPFGKANKKPWRDKPLLADGRTVHYRAFNPRKKVFAEFLDDAVRVSRMGAAGSGDVGGVEVKLSAWGRVRDNQPAATLQDAPNAFAPVTRETTRRNDDGTDGERVANRIEYARGAGMTEWYLNGPYGLEQGFTLAERPSGEGDLTFEVAITGDGITPRLSGDGERVEFETSPGVSVGTYGDLYAEDATGKIVPSHFSVTASGAVRITVNDAAATYPLVVDPSVWVFEAKLWAQGGAEWDFMGQAAAVDGDVMIVGAPGYSDDNGTPGDTSDDAESVGAAYVFERRGGVWSPSTKLLAHDGAARDRFGGSVSVSGGTALIGASETDAYKGAAYVFVRNGSTWTFQDKLLAADGAEGDFFGDVSVSGDTALIGAPGDRDQGSFTGSAYVFVRTGDTWAQQGNKLLAPDGAKFDSFGTSVSLSGSTALIGAYGDDEKGDRAGEVPPATRTG